MEGTIDHIMLNSNDYEKALKFYSWLMPKLGYTDRKEYGRTAGFMSPKNRIWLTESEGEFRSQAFDKRKVGMRELAFLGSRRAEVDEIARGVEKNGGRIIEKPYQNQRGDYQFFFMDPDGMKLEIIVRK